MGAEILQPFFLYIYADDFVETWGDEFGDKAIAAPRVQVSSDW